MPEWKYYEKQQQIEYMHKYCPEQKCVYSFENIVWQTIIQFEVTTPDFDMF